MSLELKAVEAHAFDTLWTAWESSTETEIEATFKTPQGKDLDYTAFLNVIQSLRNLGLKDDPQPPKLNIMVGGGLRFSLMGEGVIQSYCKDNSLKGKPFVCIIKDKKQAVPNKAGNKGGITEVDLPEYGVRVKLRREIPLAHDDPRVIDAILRWSSMPKSFRYIQRFSFTSLHSKGIQFDASFVRQNRKDARGNYIQATTFQGAAIPKQPTHYEVEVEAISGATKKALIFGITSVLRGLQKSYVLTRASIREAVIGLMETQTGASQRGRGSFPGSQPVTLRKNHMGLEKDADAPNIRMEDYNVTDKADGLRTLMVVAKTGRVYLIDRSLNVYGTDRKLAEDLVAEWAGAVLDGEWVTQDASGASVSRYYAFDIFNGKRGEDVSQRPFLVRGADVAVSREAAMRECIAVLNNATYVIPGIPKQNSLSIQMKIFQTPADPSDPTAIFKEASSVLNRLAKDPPYHTDGLIFTPNAAPLLKNVSTWDAQLKWKPASQNSVDFLVITEKGTTDGKPTGSDVVGTKLREDTNQIVRYKTLRLFVGSSTDPAFIDPRDTILFNKPYPSSLQELTKSTYRPVEFSPSPPDPMASVCYVAINAGATDAAGAAPAAQNIDALSDSIFCESTRDEITNRTIVEMIYRPENPAGWRWVPLRIRWDKTEDFARGVVGGTLNSEKVANDVWMSIHDPVTEFMIRTGALTEESAVPEGLPASNLAYYQRKAPQRDLNKVRGLAEFHNRYIKDDILLSKVLVPGAAVLDMSVGQAGDIHKWVNARVGWVLGTDIAQQGLVDSKNGAYRRYLQYLVKNKNVRGSHIPRCVFVQADSAVRYADGAAGQTPMDRSMLRTLWGEAADDTPPYVQQMKGMAAAGFDVVSCMFSIHYFFKDRLTLDGWLRNLAETLKVGGYFVGCCFDGDKVVALLEDLPTGGTRRGAEGGSDIWTITKRYDDMKALPANDTGLGKAIDVSFISIGDTYKEYLVSFDYLVMRMADIGLELLLPEEMATMGLVSSSNLFSVSHEMAAESGRNYPMSQSVRTFSFLNRWFIFRRRSMTTSLSMPPPVEANMSADSMPPLTDDLEGLAPKDEDEVKEEFERRLEKEGEAPELVLPELMAADLAAASEPAREEEAVEDTDAAEEDAEENEDKEEEENEEEMVVANGPAYAFYHKSAPKDDLKIKDKGWKRSLSTFAPFSFKDRTNPAIVYPNLEAVIGALKYQLGTEKPELGPQIFSTTGNIYQEYLAEKSALGEFASADQLAALADDLGAKMRAAQKGSEIKKTGAKFDVPKYINGVEAALVYYVAQRYKGDAVVQRILDAVKEQKVRLVYYIAGGETELSGKVLDDGGVSGQNAVGRAYMGVVGLVYSS